MRIGWMRVCLAICLSVAAVRLSAETVISDQGASISKQELEYIVSKWPADAQRSAANDLVDRMELLNYVMTDKKLELEAGRLTPEVDGDAYWQKEMLVRNALRKFMQERYFSSIEIPDMDAIARERYLAEKDKYAWMPATRRSSHILLRCVAAEGCNGDTVSAQAEELLVRLRAGEDFEAMVLEYSQDPGSRTKKGQLDMWLQPDMKNIDPVYLKAVFDIEKEGGYSDVVRSSFGYHIIRLDEIRDAYNRPYEEVRDRIIKDLTDEYNALNTKLFQQQYLLTDEVRMDGAVLEEIFSKYKTDD